MWIFNIYVYIINCIYKITKHINNNLKNIMLQLSLIGFGLWYMFYRVPVVRNTLYSLYYLPDHNFHQRKRLEDYELFIVLIVASFTIISSFEPIVECERRGIVLASYLAITYFLVVIILINILKKEEINEKY